MAASNDKTLPHTFLRAVLSWMQEACRIYPACTKRWREPGGLARLVMVFSVLLLVHSSTQRPSAPLEDIGLFSGHRHFLSTLPYLQISHSVNPASWSEKPETLFPASLLARTQAWASTANRTCPRPRRRPRLDPSTQGQAPCGVYFLARAWGQRWWRFQGPEPSISHGNSDTCAQSCSHGVLARAQQRVG